MSKFLNRTVKVLANPVGVPIGTIGKVINDTGSGITIDKHSSALLYREVEILALTKSSIEEIIFNLENKIKEENSKLQFMSDNNLEEYDETQFKVFQTLQTLENKDLNQLEKAKLIASLIKNENGEVPVSNM